MCPDTMPNLKSKTNVDILFFAVYTFKFDTVHDLVQNKQLCLVVTCNSYPLPKLRIVWKRQIC